MIYDEFSQDLIRNISTKKVLGYIKSKGWNEKELPDNMKDILIFENPLYPNEQIIVPARDDFIDYSRRILDIIQTLSNLEHRKPIEFVNEFLLPASDIVRFRIENEKTRTGNIPLLAGIKLLENAKDMVFTSGLTTKRPETFYKALKDKDVNEYVNSCFLGQTERGSFVANIICPIKPQLTLLETSKEKRDNTFGRETTINLMKSLEAITTSIDKDATNNTIKKSLENKEFNFNFCSAVMELKPEIENSNISIDVVWSSEIEPPKNVPSAVTIRKHHYEHIPKIIDNIRPKDKPRYEEFVGKVIALMGKAEKKEGLLEGDVMLSILGKEGNAIKAKVFLSPKDHAVACDAYKYKKTISIKGELTWGDIVKKLDKYRDFKVIN